MSLHRLIVSAPSPAGQSPAADWLGHTRLSTLTDSPFDTDPLAVTLSDSMQAAFDEWYDLIRYVDSREIEQPDNCITANLASPYQDDDFFVCVLYEYVTDRTVLYTGLIYTHTFDAAYFIVQRDGQTVRFAPLGRGELFLAIILLDEPADYEIAVQGYSDAGAKTAAVRFSWPLDITNPYEADL